MPQRSARLATHPTTRTPADVRDGGTERLDEAMDAIERFVRS